MTDLWNVCKACKNSDLIMINGTCGLPTCSAVNSFKDFSPRENRGEKTLLDEFAMAAMSGTCANSENEKLRQALDGIVSEEKQTSALVSVCYDCAAAMMRERNRRDEMGNVKEATEQ